MNDDTIDPLEPDEQFIDAFEQQLRAGIRRRDRLALAEHPVGRPRRRSTTMPVTIALMLLSLALGATGTFAVVHQDAASRRELQLQKATILLESARARLELGRAELAELLPLFEQGVTDGSDVARCRAKVARAEAVLQRRQLDLEETRLTGRAPLDTLSGPLVGGRDFVSQRLGTERAAHETERKRTEAALRRTELLMERGVISERELHAARAARHAAERALARLDQRLALRRAFLAGEHGAQEVELLGLLREAEADRAGAEARLASGRIAQERLAALYESGVVTGGELRAAEAALRESETELALAEVRVALIRQRLAEPE